MRQYITRRLLQMIPVLIGISLLVFMVLAMAPGDAVTAINPHATAEQRAVLRKEMHLDKPKLVQYGYWVKGVFSGDLGESYFYKQPVSKVMNNFLWNSFYLGLTTSVASILIAIPIGVISATKQYSFFDSFFTIFALIGTSIPTFFAALLLIKWLAVDTSMFPVSGMYAPGSTATGVPKFLDAMYHMVLPFIVLTFASIAGIMRYMRSSMLEVIRQDYIRTARAKGLKEKVVIYRHALKNALIPVITLLGFFIPGLFSGAIVTEQIFSWPGIGPIQVIATNARDYPLLMAITMLLAVLTLLGNLTADVAYAMVDPRIRLK